LTRCVLGQIECDRDHVAIVRGIRTLAWGCTTAVDGDAAGLEPAVANERLVWSFDPRRRCDRDSDAVTICVFVDIDCHQSVTKDRAK